MRISGLFLGVIVVVALLALGQIDVAAVSDAVWATEPSVFWKSLALGLAGMAAMGCYDILALRVAAPGLVGDGFAWATGVKAYGISNLLGFAILTGGAVRFPIYRERGVDLGALTNAMAMSWAAFWLAVTGVIAGVLLFDPGNTARLFDVAPVGLRWLGAALAAGMIVVLIFIGTGRRIVRIRTFTLVFPTLWVALAQTLVALAEVGLAAGALYVVLPEAAGLTFAPFFFAYAIAVSVGLISHSPGGLGAFEASLLLLTGLRATPQVLAALLVYRLVRFIIPFALAALWLSIDWARRSAVRQQK